MFDEILGHVLVDGCIDVSASGYGVEHFLHKCLVIGHCPLHSLPGA